MKQVLIFIVIHLSFITHAQNFLHPNEQLIFGFENQNNKRLVIAKDKNETYLVYRFGSKDTIELEYPTNKTNAWKKFKFSNYLRGGGKKNDAMDLKYLYFQIDKYKYVVYQEYIAEKNTTSYGIKVINLQTKKTTVIKANEKNVKGSLHFFTNKNTIEKGNELFK